MKSPAFVALVASIPLGATVGMLFHLDARARRRARRSTAPLRPAIQFIAIGAAACGIAISALLFALGGFERESELASTPEPDSARLTWVAPKTTADGSTLRDLAGFRIYYGTASKNYTASITVANPAATTYTVRSLPPGTYYFVVKAFDKSRAESAPSAEVSKTIQ